MISTWRKARRILFVSAPLGLFGCQLLLATDGAQCASDADCAAKSGAPLVCRDAVCVAAAPAPSSDAGDDAAVVDPTTPWGCLADPPARAPEDRSQPATLRHRFRTFATLDCQQDRPIAGAEVKLCSQSDRTCGAPVETALTDCDGYVTFKAAYRGFRGFMMIEPPTPSTNDAGALTWSPVTTKCFQDLYDKEAAEGRSGERCAIQKDAAGQIVVPLPTDLIPGIVSIVPSTEREPDALIPEGKAPAIMSASTITTLLTLVARPLADKTGHLIGIGLSCQGAASPGVTMSITGAIGPDSQLFYTDSQSLPNVNQGQTSEEGVTGYLNLDPGPSGVTVIGVTATRHATGERIGTYEVLIRSGYTSYVDMEPLED